MAVDAYQRRQRSHFELNCAHISPPSGTSTMKLPGESENSHAENLSPFLYRLCIGSVSKSLKIHFSLT